MHCTQQGFSERTLWLVELGCAVSACDTVEKLNMSWQLECDAGSEVLACSPPQMAH